jgi:hypothetical protein
MTFSYDEVRLLVYLWWCSVELFFFLFAKWVCWFEFFAEGRLFLLVFGCFRVFWLFRNEAGVCMGIGGLFLLAGCMYSSASLIDIEVLGVLVF